MGGSQAARAARLGLVLGGAGGLLRRLRLLPLPTASEYQVERFLTVPYIQIPPPATPAGTNIMEGSELMAMASSNDGWDEQLAAKVGEGCRRGAGWTASLHGPQRRPASRPPTPPRSGCTPPPQPTHRTATPTPTSMQANEVDGFAGVYPEHKYLIVQALQGRGRLIGMTGALALLLAAAARAGADRLGLAGLSRECAAAQQAASTAAHPACCCPDAAQATA